MRKRSVTRGAADKSDSWEQLPCLSAEVRSAAPPLHSRQPRHLIVLFLTLEEIALQPLFPNEEILTPVMGKESDNNVCQ